MNPILRNSFRRALVAALTTTAVLALVVFIYWSLALRGLVPGPDRPLISKRAETQSLTNSIMVHPLTGHQQNPKNAVSKPVQEVSLEVKTSEPNLVDEVAKAAASLPAKPSALEAKEIIELPEHNQQEPIISTTNRTIIPMLPERTRDDRRIAAEWTTSTNDRPIVQVEYRRPDIIALLNARRGLLVAASNDTPQRHEFCLPSTATLDFVKLTPAIASGFANFGVSLRNAAEISRLTVALPAYFGNKPFALEFVPDRNLAEQIFVNVSRAIRAVSEKGSDVKGIVVEGTLYLRQKEPVFSVSKVLWTGGELSFAKSD
jgi:hypothetical protein